MKLYLWGSERCSALFTTIRSSKSLVVMPGFTASHCLLSGHELVSNTPLLALFVTVYFRLAVGFSLSCISGVQRAALLSLIQLGEVSP